MTPTILQLPKAYAVRRQPSISSGRDVYGGLQRSIRALRDTTDDIERYGKEIKIEIHHLVMTTKKLKLELKRECDGGSCGLTGKLRALQQRNKRLIRELEEVNERNRELRKVIAWLEDDENI